jgi:hypothetical protein
VPSLLLKALEVAGNGRIWLVVPISLLLLSASPANASGSVSPLLAGLVIDLALVGLAIDFSARDPTVHQSVRSCRCVARVRLRVPVEAHDRGRVFTTRTLLASSGSIPLPS